MLCGWEDDGQDDSDADEVKGGPNYQLSLTRARSNFKTYRDICHPTEDRSLMRDTETEWTAKGIAIAAFEAMKLTLGPNRLTDLWRRIDEVDRFLARMLSARLREHEHRHQGR
jgi:hypothetical protein